MRVSIVPLHHCRTSGSRPWPRLVHLFVFGYATVPRLPSVGDRHASGPRQLRLTRVNERVPCHKISETVLIGKNLPMAGAIA